MKKAIIVRYSTDQSEFVKVDGKIVYEPSQLWNSTDICCEQWCRENGYEYEIVWY